MKKNTCKISFLFLFLFSLLFNGSLAKASDFKRLMDAPRWANLSAVSSNGEYMVLYTGEYAGALYKRSTGEYFNLSKDFPVYAKNVSNNGIVVGEFFDVNTTVEGKSVLTAGYWQDGTWYKLPYPKGYVVELETSAPTAWGISDDGTFIVGGIYYNRFSEYYTISWKNFAFDTIYHKTPFTDINPKKNKLGRPNGVSGNGKVIYGWGTNYDAKGNQISDRSPVLWYSVDSTLALGIKDYRPGGEILSMNENGSIAVGTLNEFAFVWDAEKGGRIIENLELFHTQGFGLGVSDDGTIVGISMAATSNSRRAFIYKNDVLYNLKEYASELYGIDFGNLELEYIRKISPDGKTFFGSDSEGYPFILTLEGDYLPTAPRKGSAKQIKNTSNVSVSWNLPFANGMTIASYNVYRDGEKINTEAVTSLNFTDMSIPSGIHQYQLSTVYTNGSESAKSKGFSIQVIDPAGCYAPQSASAELEYNVNVKLTWGTPSANIGNAKKFTQPTKRNLVEGLSNPFKINANGNLALNSKNENISAVFDTIKRFEFLNMTELNLLGEQAVVTDGEFIYTAIWDKPGIGKYTLDGIYVESLNFEGTEDIYNMTYDGKYFYATKFNRNMTGGEQQKDTLYKFDFTNGLLVEKIKLEKPAMYIAYIPELDEGEGGFLYGNVKASRYANMQGATIGNGIKAPLASGVSYYKGKIIALEQIGIPLRERFAQINEYDITTGERIGTSVDVYNYAEFNELPFFFAGGITVGKNADGVLCAMMILQTEPQCLLVSLEIEKMEGLLGYTIYKDDVKLNSTPYPYRNFVDKENNPGTYNYKISAVFDNNCESAKTNTMTVIIQPQGECMAPDNITLKSYYEFVNIKWELPLSASQNLVGFNIYRDGEKINKNPLSQPVYIDKLDMDDEKTYRYQVSAFYDMGCEQLSEAKEIKVSKNGKRLAVNKLNAKVVDKNIQVQWNPPYFDEPLPIRYGSGVMTDAIGLNEAGSYMGVIGWGPNQLAQYDGFNIVGLEVFIRDLPIAMNLIVMVDEKIVIDQKIDIKDVKANDFNFFLLDEPLTIDSKLELVVGFDVRQAVGKYILGVDAGPAVTTFGDLISLDMGATWKYLQSSNWIIAAGITKYRDMNAKQESDVNLLGYDLYVNNTKRNTSPLKLAEFSDGEISPNNTYTYKVASVWEAGEAMFSDEVSVLYAPNAIEEQHEGSVKISPIPVKELLQINNLEGYISIELKDLTGRSIRTKTVSSDTEFIDCSDLNSGAYLLVLKKNKGVALTRKIVKN